DGARARVPAPRRIRVVVRHVYAEAVVDVDRARVVVGLAGGPSGAPTGRQAVRIVPVSTALSRQERVPLGRVQGGALEPVVKNKLGRAVSARRGHLSLAEPSVPGRDGALR